MKKTTRAKSPYDQAIYDETRSLVSHGYFAQIARRYNLPYQNVSRIMLGFYDESSGVHKAIREDILSKAAAIKATKDREARKIGLILQK